MVNSEKEIQQHLTLALSEIGQIVPWFDEETEEWVFEHPHYPVLYGGQSSDEVKQNYPLYLKEFIQQRLAKNLNPLTEKETTGRGGVRPGAGRKPGSKKPPTKRISLPVDIATWLQDNPEHQEAVRKMM